MWDRARVWTLFTAQHRLSTWSTHSLRFSWVGHRSFSLKKSVIKTFFRCHCFVKTTKKNMFHVVCRTGECILSRVCLLIWVVKRKFSLRQIYRRPVWPLDSLKSDDSFQSPAQSLEVRVSSNTSCQVCCIKERQENTKKWCSIKVQNKYMPCAGWDKRNHTWVD